MRSIRTAPAGWLLALAFLSAAASFVPVHAKQSGPNRGDQIVQAINARDRGAFSRLIDMEALGERVISRLELPAHSREDFLHGIATGKATLIATLMDRFEIANARARLLSSRPHGKGSRHLIRIDRFDADGDFDGMDYMEFELHADGRIADWHSHAISTPQSQVMARLAGLMLQEESPLLRRLGRQRVDREMVELVRALGVHIRANEMQAAYDTMGRFPEAFRDTVDWAVWRANLAAQLGEESLYRASLAHLARHFPDRSELQFLLIDHYFYTHDYARALAAIEHFRREVVDDGAMQRLACVIASEAGDLDGAIRACRRGVELEPDVEYGWWQLVAMAQLQRNADLVLQTLTDYEHQFQLVFDPDELLRFEDYAWLAEAPGFKAWADARR